MIEILTILAKNNRLNYRRMKSQYRRIILMVLDSLGVGELPDAKEYGDEGSHTLEHACLAVGGIALPHLESLGLSFLAKLRAQQEEPKKLIGSYGKMAELSKGKDTTTGHWEMMGVITEKALPTYPHGFPKKLIQEFEKKIGRKTLGNIPASGTEIIQQLGEEHYKTGSPIVYTSQDSVFQVAAHEEIIPLEKLYEICKIARSMLKGEHAVGRVIARPFVGLPGSFTRTHHRHDYSLEPFSQTLLDEMQARQISCISVGKIWDIFAGRGISRHVSAGPNKEVMDNSLKTLQEAAFTDGFLFVNLVDFDMLYNHRQDPKGLSQALLEFDHFLPSFFEAMRKDDLLMITADHGNDPTDQSTDHTREYVPILCYGKELPGGKNLGIRSSFADCGQTIAEIFNIPPLKVGKSFTKELSL